MYSKRVFLTVGTITLALALAVSTFSAIKISAYAQTSRSGSQIASLGDKWWQRYLSMEVTPQTNPFTRVFQGDCSQLIQGNTIFLVGQVFGTSIVNHGTCIISPQTSLLFPLINGVDVDCQNMNQQMHISVPGVCTFTKQTPARGEPFGPLRSLASVSGATSLAAFLVSGATTVPLNFVRAQSPPGGFEVLVAVNNIFGANIGPVPVPLHGVSDGFWVLLPSLPIGTHSLIFRGCLPSPSGPLCQTNSYTIVVR